jgi:hypothetical protein
MDRRTFVHLAAATAASSLLTRTVYAQRAPKAKNVVLVHGLFADGSCWSEVIPRLQAAGLNVTSVQNPLTTLPEAVASALRVLARQDGPTVLVLLCHRTRRLFRVKRRVQHGQRGKLRAIATSSLR